MADIVDSASVVLAVVVVVVSDTSRTSSSVCDARRRLVAAIGRDDTFTACGTNESLVDNLLD